MHGDGRRTTELIGDRTCKYVNTRACLPGLRADDELKVLKQMEDTGRHRSVACTHAGTGVRVNRQGCGPSCVVLPNRLPAYIVPSVYI